MKKTIATIFVLVLQFTIHAQWINKNPFPEGNYLRSVCFVDDNTGWISGSDGLIAYTSDSGVTWNRQLSGTSNLLKSIFFIDSSNGWTVGETGEILYSTDGGSNWSSQSSNTSNTLNSVFFINSNTGWAAGADGIILRTTNGGTQWEVQNSGTSLEIFTIKFVNDSVGYAVGGDGFAQELMLKTTDGGNSWTSLSSGTDGVLYSVSFVDENNGWTVGFDSKILHTSDGGSTWDLQNLGKRSNPLGKMTVIDGQGGLRSVYFKDSQHGWAVGGSNEYYRNIYKTTDGGTTWELKYLGLEEYDLFSIAVTPSGKSWAVGGAGSIFYAGDGDHWIQQFSGTSSYNADDIYKIQFMNGSIGYAAGFRNDFIVGSSLILKTTNGGNTWLTTYLESETGEPFKSLFFIDEFNGWAGGYNGAIVHTTDGGADWNTVSVGSGFSVNSLFFTDALTGFAAGDGIYKTTDSGNTWSSKYSGNINAVRFIDNLTGWAIGANIVKTTDGGETWMEQDVTGGNDIFFYSSLNGWAVGNAGIIKVTTDGGTTWTNQSAGTSEDLTSVNFTTGLNGWISGRNGIILSTGDGGTNWTGQLTGTSKNINAVYFSEITNGWAGGAEGTLLKYDESLISFLTLTSPNGGEVLLSGDQSDISWNSNISGNVNLYLYKGTERIKVIAKNRMNQGSYSWRVKRVPAGNDYRILVESVGDPSVFDFSDSTFSIIGGKTKSYILVTSPLGGEEWHTGDTKEIRWLTNYQGDVSISLFKGNALVNEIINSTSNTDSFNWSIPSDIEPGDNYQIKITCSSLPSLFAFSDSTFTITGGEVVTEVENQLAAPHENSLSQNYPNPFNPSTVINYNIAGAGYVTLKVYDVTGREVASLVDDIKPEGRYSVSFNGSKLASGVYFYILRNGNFVETKKFMLVK